MWVIGPARWRALIQHTPHPAIAKPVVDRVPAGVNSLAAP